MPTKHSRFWLAMALFALGVVFRGGALTWSLLIASVLLVCEELQPQWYRPPAWLRRPNLGVIASGVFVLNSIFYDEMTLAVALWLAGAGVFIWDARERGDFRALPGMVQSAKEALRAPPAAAGESGTPPVVPPRSRRLAQVGLAVCLGSLLLTWAPYNYSGFITWERTGTVYVDGAGRTVRDATYNTPEWQDTSSPAENGLQLSQGWFVLLVAGSLLAIMGTRRYENPRLRNLAVKFGPPALMLGLYANGYAGEGLGWWVYLAGLGAFSTAAWHHWTAERRVQRAVAIGTSTPQL